MKRLLIAAAIACGFFMPAIAQEQPRTVCMPIAKLAEAVKEKYQEAPFVVGNIEDNYSMIMFFNFETGTFTQAVISPEGMACVIGSGTHLQPAGKVGTPT